MPFLSYLRANSNSGAQVKVVLIHNKPQPESIDTKVLGHPIDYMHQLRINVAFNIREAKDRREGFKVRVIKRGETIDFIKDYMEGMRRGKL
jgi:hypothetical protein